MLKVMIVILQERSLSSFYDSGWSRGCKPQWHGGACFLLQAKQSCWNFPVYVELKIGQGVSVLFVQYLCVCVCRLIRAKAYCNTLHTHMTKPEGFTCSVSVRPQMGEALLRIGFATEQLHSSILWQKHKHCAFKPVFWSFVWMSVWTEVRWVGTFVLGDQLRAWTSRVILQLCSNLLCTQ